MSERPTPDPPGSHLPAREDRPGARAPRPHSQGPSTPPSTSLADTVELLDLALAVLANDSEALEALASRGRPDRRWRETLLMTALFAGVPRVVAAFGRLARRTPTEPLGPLDPDELDETPDLAAAGTACFSQVYGDAADEVHETLAAGHPLLARWVREFAYGRVLARDGLALAERELIAVACLTALALPRQLASHVRGAKRAGAADDAIRAALERGLPLAPHEAHEALRAVGARFLLGE